MISSMVSNEHSPSLGMLAHAHEVDESLLTRIHTTHTLVLEPIWCRVVAFSPSHLTILVRDLVLTSLRSITVRVLNKNLHRVLKFFVVVQPEADLVLGLLPKVIPV